MISVFKARMTLMRALKKVNSRFWIVFLLDKMTVLKLNELLTKDPEGEREHMRSIAETPSYFMRKLKRSDLSLYATNHEDVHAVISRSQETDWRTGSKSTGELFRWLEHFGAGGKTPEDKRIALKLINGWDRNTRYMSVYFSELNEAGILEYVRKNPETMDRVLEVLNAIPESSVPWQRKDISKVVEISRSVSALQEGVL
jgi:hypothetical protein